MTDRHGDISRCGGSHGICQDGRHSQAFVPDVLQEDEKPLREGGVGSRHGVESISPEEVPKELARFEGVVKRVLRGGRQRRLVTGCVEGLSEDASFLFCREAEIMGGGRGGWTQGQEQLAGRRIV